MPLSPIKISKRNKNMIFPGRTDADVLPGSGSSTSAGWMLDYRAIQVGDSNVQLNMADDEQDTKTHTALDLCSNWWIGDYLVKLNGVFWEQAAVLSWPWLGTVRLTRQKQKSDGTWTEVHKNIDENTLLKLVPNKNNDADDTIDRHLSDHNIVYRGISQAELEFIKNNDYILSDQRWCIPGEGTCFAKSYDDAESYINFGRTSPDKTGIPTYVIELQLQKGDVEIDKRDYYPKAKNKIPASRIKRIWRFKTRDNPEKGIWSNGFAEKENNLDDQYQKNINYGLFNTDTDLTGRGSFVGSKDEDFELFKTMSLRKENCNDKLSLAFPNLPQYSNLNMYYKSIENPHNEATPVYDIFEQNFVDDDGYNKDDIKIAFPDYPQYIDSSLYDQASEGIDAYTTQQFDELNTYYADDIIEVSDENLAEKELNRVVNNLRSNGMTDDEIAQALVRDGAKGGFIWPIEIIYDFVKEVPKKHNNINDIVEATDDSSFIKTAFLKTAITYDANNIIQQLTNIPQVKALIEQTASSFVDRIIVTTPSADLSQTQQQLDISNQQNNKLQPIDGDPFGHVWMNEDPLTHQKKPIDKIVRIDKVTDLYGTLTTMLHEILHLRHPSHSESQVEAEAISLADTVKQHLNIKTASKNKKVLFVKNNLSVLPIVECDLADTYQKQVTGLQNHTSLKPQNGMLFTYHKSQPLQFWMGKVSFPIDIIFANNNNTITKIYHNCRPNTMDVYACNNVSKVIEVIGNFCSFHNLSEGDQVFAADDEPSSDENFTKYIFEKIKKIKLEQQADLDMTHWSIKIVMKKEPDKNKFIKVNWNDNDYKIQKADILINPDLNLMREALKKMPIDKLVRHALLHILVGHKEELEEDREKALITNRLFKDNRANIIQNELKKRSINK